MLGNLVCPLNLIRAGKIVQALCLNLSGTNGKLVLSVQFKNRPNLAGRGPPPPRDRDLDKLAKALPRFKLIFYLQSYLTYSARAGQIKAKSLALISVFKTEINSFDRLLERFYELKPQARLKICGLNSRAGGPSPPN